MTDQKAFEEYTGFTEIREQFDMDFEETYNTREKSVESYEPHFSTSTEKNLHGVEFDGLFVQMRSG